MPLTTTITPANVAVALGEPAPDPGSAKDAQWSMWITDALMLIQVRVDSIDPVPTVDQARLDYVIREAVVAQARRPDDATQVTVSVDDASTSRTYKSSRGRIDILDEWWTLLGLVAPSGGAFDVDTVSTTARHQPWCDLAFGGLSCSCGADLAGYPLWEF